MELNTVREIPYRSLHTHVLFSINIIFFNSTGVMNRIVNFISTSKTRKEEKNSFSHNSNSAMKRKPYFSTLYWITIYKLVEQELTVQRE